MITQQVSKELTSICALAKSKLASANNIDFKSKPAPNKWSRQEILGHLIDSAANNHQRFIRVQFEDEPTIFYDQDNWVNHNHYNELLLGELIELWASYNRHLASIIEKIPTENLGRCCRMRDGRLVTLEWLITDYVAHMKHHFQQIFGEPIK